MKRCFIVCPIGADGSETRKNSDTVLKHIIQPVCTELDFEVIRVDQIYAADRIDNTIYEHLKTADLVIADMSEHNPNAFYEIGYRHALEKPLIPIMREGTNIPFDLASLRTITYATDDLDKASTAKERLRETISSFKYPMENDDNDDLPKQETHQTNLVPHLLKIQDEIINLKNIMLERNNEVAATAVDLAMGQIAKNTVDPQLKAMEIMLPQIISNPEKFSNFFEIVKNINQND